MSTKYRSIILIVFLLLASAAQAERMMVPVGLNMTTSVQENGMVMLTVYLSVQDDVKKAMLQVKAPADARLYEGMTRWEGDLKKGNVIKLVSWYELSGSSLNNATAWRVIAGGTIDGMHRYRMQPVYLSHAQLVAISGGQQQVSAVSPATIHQAR